MILEERIVRNKKISKFSRGNNYVIYEIFLIIGNKNGGIGFGKSKSKDQNFSINRALYRAKKNFFKFPLINGTIYHEIFGKHCNSTVVLYPSKKGNGIFAGGVVRSVIELSGIKNIISKVYGSNNMYNVIIALFNALKNLTSLFYILKKRNKKYKDFF